MYICPECGREFYTENAVAKHVLECWREQHPFHKSTPAPRSADINTRTANIEIMNFFNSLERKNHD